MDPNILAQISQQAGQQPQPPMEAPVDPMDAETKIIIQALIKRLEFNSKAKEMGMVPQGQPPMGPMM